jgi:cytochrome c2
MLVHLAGGLALLLSVLAIRWKQESSRWNGRLLIGGLLVLNALIVMGADRGALVALRFRSGLDLALPPVSEPAVPGASEQLSEGVASRGRGLYAKLACGNCHGPDRTLEAPGIPPSLKYAGSKLRAPWIIRYLQEPQRIRWLDTDTRPLVRMPDYQLGPSEASDLASFLATQTDSVGFPVRPIEAPPITETEAEEGRGLVAQYACTGCHTIGGSGNRVGPALDDIGSRLRPAYLYAFLMDPKGIIPGTPMKDFGLWHEEARSLTAYLTTLRATDE